MTLENNYYGIPFGGDSFDICNVVATWERTAPVAPDIVNDKYTTGITNVFGATCDYVNVDDSKDYEDYNEGDTVGNLNCNKYDQAPFVKTPDNYKLCYGGFGVALYTQTLVNCTW
ncbi:hypothetical protein V8C42DRAFT_340013 [Trichoderma barbatum]